MLGFSQYSQVSYVAIIEQKIRIFLLSIFTLSPRLAGLMQGSLKSSGTLQSAVVDSLFALFVQTLKDKNIYEEYLIPSVFIEDINYDFITNEDSRTLEIAEQNFKDAFFRVLKETLNVDQAVVPNENKEPSSAFLTALLIAGKIRRIPSYKDDLFLQPSDKELVDPISSLFSGDASPNDNVFYLETFYRIKKDIAENLKEDEVKEAQFLSVVEAAQFNNKKLKGPLADNFVKGIRLMMNITSSISFTANAFVPKFDGTVDLPAYNKNSLRKLPFLDKEILEKLAQICIFKNNNRNYFRLPLFNAVKKDPKDVFFKTIGVSKEEVMNGTRETLKIVKSKTNDKDAFRSSKTLVCVETLQSAKAVDEALAVYFPISMSEFVSDKLNPTDVELANGLSTTTTFNEFFVTANISELIQIVQTLIRFFSINAVEFFDAADNSAIKSQNEALDNMITNLINFDEV